jgi:hypothetical protein
MANTANLQDEFIPTLSLMFRLLIHRSAVWLQFVPALISCTWALWYFWTRERWNWIEQGLLLLIVSVIVAPYAWFTDEAILLPVILAGLYKASNRLLLAFASFAAVALLEVLTGVNINSGFYLWTAPAWLAWYHCATKPSYAMNVYDPQMPDGLETNEVASDDSPRGN